MKNHEKRVQEFFRQCKQEDPARVNEVNAKYPVTTRDRYRTQKRREQPVGLLGLQPANLPMDIAFEIGYESIYLKEEGDSP